MQWIEAKVEEFLGTGKSYFTIDIYSSEITRIEKKYPFLEVLKGPYTNASTTDKRISCIIRKKSK